MSSEKSIIAIRSQVQPFRIWQLYTVVFKNRVCFCTSNTRYDFMYYYSNLCKYTSPYRDNGINGWMSSRWYIQIMTRQSHYGTEHNIAMFDAMIILYINEYNWNDICCHSRSIPDLEGSWVNFMDCLILARNYYMYTDLYPITIATSRHIATKTRTFHLRTEVVYLITNTSRKW